MLYREIPLTALPGVAIGHAQDPEAATGCTVLLFGPDGAPAGLDVRGGGPASRESELLKPMAAAGAIHAILLSGGSAFGLDAAGGVQQYLEERGIGFDVGVARVPLVLPGLPVRTSASAAPGCARTGLWATPPAGPPGPGVLQTGNVGAGTGATVGKTSGMARCMKAGLGAYAVQLGEVQVGALVAVNALGDVYGADGRRLAGLRDADGVFRPDSPGAEDALLGTTEVVENKFTGNTTLGVVLTNARFPKAALCKIAGMAHDGYARAIRPVHTTADGDSIFAVSLGNLAADQDTVGALAARVMAEAIRRAVHVPGVPGAPGCWIHNTKIPSFPPQRPQNALRRCFCARGSARRALLLAGEWCTIKRVCAAPRPGMLERGAAGAAGLCSPGRPRQTGGYFGKPEQTERSDGRLFPRRVQTGGAS